MSTNTSRYPEDEDRKDYLEMLIEVPRSTRDLQQPSILLDTNVVRNIVDFVRNPHNKATTVVSRLQNLRQKNGYSVNCLWGIAEDCYHRLTRDFNAEKAAEQLLLVKHFFATSFGEKLDVESAEHHNSITNLTTITSPLGEYIDSIVRDKIVPRYICGLKIHQIYLDTGVSNKSAKTYLSWFLDELDIFPMHEALLGLTLLAPQRDLTEKGVHWRRIANAIFKVDKRSDPLRWSWGAAWDLTIARVREANEALSLEMINGYQAIPKSTLLVTNEHVITDLNSSVFRGPRNSDIFSSNIPSSIDQIAEVYSVPELFKAETYLGQRLSDFHIERANVIAMRADMGQMYPPTPDFPSIQRNLEELLHMH